VVWRQRGADRIDRTTSLARFCTRIVSTAAGTERLGAWPLGARPQPDWTSSITSGTVTHGSRLYAGHVGHERAAKLALDDEAIAAAGQRSAVNTRAHSGGLNELATNMCYVS